MVNSQKFREGFIREFYAKPRRIRNPMPATMNLKCTREGGGFHYYENGCG
jgi:hypothetical protein